MEQHETMKDDLVEPAWLADAPLSMMEPLSDETDVWVNDSPMWEVALEMIRVNDPIINDMAVTTPEVQLARSILEQNQIEEGGSHE